MAVLCRQAIERGATALTLEVRAGNTAAQSLYRRFGFAPAGVRREYYKDSGEDALVMWAYDVDAPAYAERLAAIEAPLAATTQVEGLAVGRVRAGRRGRVRDRWPAVTGTRILGIETSCDETAAAVVVDARQVLSSVVSSQVEIHARFGGVVPEIASRAHVESLTPVIARALDRGRHQRRPRRRGRCHRRSGSGRRAARRAQRGQGAGARVGRARSSAVNHLEAHLYAALLEEPDLELPIVVLLVSGGHTLLVLMEGHGRYHLLGSTIDDAAGEAFDKVARYLGLGYPGGPAIDQISLEGDPQAIAFPRAILADGYDFSFSGLKTSVVNHVRRHPEVATADVAASFQEAVVDVLVTKARRAAAEHGAKGLALAGGVAANSQLRDPAARRLHGRRAAPVPAQPGDVHRQRRHGGGGGLVAPAERRPVAARHRRQPRSTTTDSGGIARCSADNSAERGSDMSLARRAAGKPSGTRRKTCTSPAVTRSAPAAPAGPHDRVGPLVRRLAGDLRHRRRLVPHGVVHPLVGQVAGRSSGSTSSS